METLTIQLPEGAEGKKIKAVLKALGVSFGKADCATENSSEKSKSYNPEFVAMVQQAQQEIQEGKVHRINLEEFWK